jgi:hypothetical protein
VLRPHDENRGTFFFCSERDHTHSRSRRRVPGKEDKLYLGACPPGTHGVGLSWPTFPHPLLKSLLTQSARSAHWDVGTQCAEDKERLVVIAPYQRAKERPAAAHLRDRWHVTC